MPRLIETKEPRPEYSTVINWTVPVYIKNGEDYYKVCFDIKRKPLSDDSLPLTKEELEEFKKLFNYEDEYKQVYIIGNSIYRITNYKAILYLAERFDLTGKK